MARKSSIENSPELDPDERQRVAEVVGLGAIKYADLSQNRISDYVFDWQKMMAMNGNTATYLQYAYARIQSIFRKGGSRRKRSGGRRPAIALSHPAERGLGVRLLRLPEVLELAASELKPNILTDYLFELANAFSTFFEGCPVLKAESPERRDSRLAAVRPDRQDLEIWTRPPWNRYCGTNVKRSRAGSTASSATRKRLSDDVDRLLRSDFHAERRAISPARFARRRHARVLVVARLWPLTTLTVRDVPGRELDRTRGTSRIARRSPWPFRRTARAFGRQPDVRERSRWSIRSLPGCSTSSRPATSPPEWRLSRDGRRGVVTHWYGYDLAILELKDDKIAVAGRIEVGPEPRGVAMTADGSTAFVAVGVSNEVVRVDLNAERSPAG